MYASYTPSMHCYERVATFRHGWVTLGLAYKYKHAKEILLPLQEELEYGAFTLREINITLPQNSFVGGNYLVLYSFSLCIYILCTLKKLSPPHMHITLGLAYECKHANEIARCKWNLLRCLDTKTDKKGLTMFVWRCSILHRVSFRFPSQLPSTRLGLVETKLFCIDDNKRNFLEKRKLLLVTEFDITGFDVICDVN